MKHPSTFRIIAAIGLVALLALQSVAVFADGTETLGPPSIPIALGSGHVAAGTGLIDQPGTIDITVPGDALIEQVLLYWEGHAACGWDPTITNTNDCRRGQNITVDGNAVVGQMIGGPTLFYNLFGVGYYSISYRADVTGLDLVEPGANSVSVSGVDFDVNSPALGLLEGFANGASLVVIYDDGTFATVDIRDGNDNAFFDFDPTLDTTVPQTFNFDPEPQNRTADLTLLVGSVLSPEHSPVGPRPTRITVAVNGTIDEFDSVLGSIDGPAWDTLNLAITIPAGASSLTVQVLSFDDGSGDLPASLSWVAAALSVPITPTNGAGAGTPGYWKNHPEAWPLEVITIGGVDYTKQQAIDIMNAKPKGDMTYSMFNHLVAAILNGVAGADTSCVTGTIADAHDWMATYGPVGSGVKANSGAWEIGEPLKNTLDQYNNGLLCAPPRD